MRRTGSHAWNRARRALVLHLQGDKTRLSGEQGYIVLLVMLILMVVGMMSAALLTMISFNIQHVARDRSYTQSLAVAEAGLNQYLWMVASGESSEASDFALPGNPGPDPHRQTFALADQQDGSTKGTYTIEVTPPSGSDSRVKVTVTGTASSATEVPRTVTAHVGRPSFSEYLLLTDEQVNIGGPLDRVWHGKTHSNTGILIDTAAIVDTISCARASYEYSGGQTKPGVWSQDVPLQHGSRALWKYPVPPIDFNTVTSDFVRLSALATGNHNLPYVEPSQPGRAHGWYIKILPDERYQVARVLNEHESKNYGSGNNRGGYLTIDTGTLSTRSFPDQGVIYVNDNVWVEGTGVEGRLTIASSGQLNPPGKRDATNINVVGDLTYARKDGSCVVGLVAQYNIKIPQYAPKGKSGSMSQMTMEIDAALVAQEGAEYVNYDSSGQHNGWGPRRGLLIMYGSVASRQTPFRRTSDLQGSNDYAGFRDGDNRYDSFLLHNPPPHFPTVGTYQILDWRELPAGQAVSEG